MKWRIALLLLLGSALAQTLVEVTTVAALQSSLVSGVRFPSGSFKAGKGSEAIVARIPDAARFDLEVYAARGIASRLHDAFVMQIMTSFASAGYLQEGWPQTQQIGGETRTRYDFRDDSGKAALLFIVRKGDELVFVVGKQR
ncbi:hypothetical protein [Calidithermus timidus]|jgi:hypothetical protein|uniref:hypothetical protein n=1 Tax=Calidithermus timidus TaxID=307124 RepID=UPI00037EB851|nr:hypothetical protein [Calidithermus timidus]